jgi:hypothetical protein
MNPRVGNDLQGIGWVRHEHSRQFPAKYSGVHTAFVSPSQREYRVRMLVSEQLVAFCRAAIEEHAGVAVMKMQVEGKRESDQKTQPSA